MPSLLLSDPRIGERKQQFAGSDRALGQKITQPVAF